MNTCTKCGAKFQTRIGIDSFYCDECLKGITLRIFNCDYCTCKDNEPEEIERGVIMCLKCNHQVNPADFPDEPEPSDEEIEFYQEAGREHVLEMVFNK